MGIGILLIHGFTGAPEDFGDLPACLAARYGSEAVQTVSLPGHGSGQPPQFDTELLLAAVRAAAAHFQERGHDLVLICHSTGGTLALAALADQLPALRLLVLAAVPKRIDHAYLARWSSHARQGNAITLTSLAAMVSLVNRVHSHAPSADCPVLLLQGEADELVPCAEVDLWERACTGPLRTVIAPDAGHHLFQGKPAKFVEDLLLRAVADACYRPGAEELATVDRLVAVEPEAARFFARSPGSVRHLAASPAGLMLRDRIPQLADQPGGEPLFVNIEVTTRCNLRCAFCARTMRQGEGRDMPVERFRRILDLLPHGYRVTLVGLGEPLQHPEIGKLVAEAACRGRRVAVVTNALELSTEVGQELLDAGLHAITFSLDAALQEVADLVRAGSNLERILGNIRNFARLSDAVRKVPRSVFSAVSAQTLPHLEQLVRTAATLEVDAMMLSDLNFAANLSNTLWRAGEDVVLSSVRQAVRTAFSLGLPVLSVHGLEELGLSQRYTRHLLAPASRLSDRTSRRTHCFSPWQTVAVSVDGTVTACDCQPEAAAGNLLRDPFDAIWQGSVLTRQRRQMLGDSPPDPCCICPRF